MAHSMNRERKINRMNDTIYREAAKDVIANMEAVGYSPYATIGRLDALLALNRLPSAERRGQWIIDKEFSNIGRCSFCGDRWGSVDQMNYCPSCGARMECEWSE